MQDALTRAVYGKEAPTAKALFYEVADKTMDGTEVHMSQYAGSVLLLVNVASKCGLTKASYEELPKLHDEFGARGLKILAFPCSQFAGQEFGESEQICEFVKTYDEKMTDKLIFFEKGDVNGANAREVFSFLKQKLPNEDGTTDIRWNFTKFLVDHEGNPYKRYGPQTNPFQLKDDIEELLKKKETSS